MVYQKTGFLRLLYYSESQVLVVQGIDYDTDWIIDNNNQDDGKN